MNNTIMRTIDVTTEYQPLADSRVIGTVTVSCLPANGEVVYFRGDTGQDVPWVPGEYHELHSVNLADIQIKGTAGDVVTVVGGTW